MRPATRFVADRVVGSRLVRDAVVPMPDPWNLFHLSSERRALGKCCRCGTARGSLATLSESCASLLRLSTCCVAIPQPPDPLSRAPDPGRMPRRVPVPWGTVPCPGVKVNPHEQESRGSRCRTSPLGRMRLDPSLRGSPVYDPACLSGDTSHGRLAELILYQQVVRTARFGRSAGPGRRGGGVGGRAERSGASFVRGRRRRRLVTRGHCRRIPARRAPAH